ncbi:hypothetical protein V5E97_04145 [Singulisphaera sp. Ch08]|uniref:Uncharacterized protein n=1 Tax=Singulisphaera sp. Ch08 TaxID=3120278 RepID=A0AAU7CJM9_9BACT
MSLACEVLLESDEPAMLDTIDSFLEAAADRIDRTRKGRVWNLWIDERPIHVEVVDQPPSIGLSSACDDAHDDSVLRRLAKGLATACGGLALEPPK